MQKSSSIISSPVQSRQECSSMTTLNNFIKNQPNSSQNSLESKFAQLNKYDNVTIIRLRKNDGNHRYRHLQHPMKRTSRLPIAKPLIPVKNACPFLRTSSDFPGDFLFQGHKVVPDFEKRSKAKSAWHKMSRETKRGGIRSANQRHFWPQIPRI
jgi:hypothetical protein